MFVARDRQGEMAERSKAADCKSAGVSLRGFESYSPQRLGQFAGVAQLARASAFQAEGRGFESRLPLASDTAHVAQSVEHILGKDEVGGSSPLVGCENLTVLKHSFRDKGGIRDVQSEI